MVGIAHALDFVGVGASKDEKLDVGGMLWKRYCRHPRDIEFTQSVTDSHPHDASLDRFILSGLAVHADHVVLQPSVRSLVGTVRVLCTKSGASPPIRGGERKIEILKAIIEPENIRDELLRALYEADYYSLSERQQRIVFDGAAIPPNPAGHYANLIERLVKIGIDGWNSILTHRSREVARKHTLLFTRAAKRKWVRF